MMQSPMAQEEGQDLVEYALVVGIISIALVFVLQNVASDVNAVFSTIASQLSGTI
jgi:pilus assembly protein Flp/PilA